MEWRKICKCTLVRTVEGIGLAIRSPVQCSRVGNCTWHGLCAQDLELWSNVTHPGARIAGQFMQLRTIVNRHGEIEHVSTVDVLFWHRCLTRSIAL